MAAVATGLDRVLQSGLPLPGRGRVAVLCNATTVSAGWVPTLDALRRVPGLTLVAALSPQHGFASEQQDNMVESPGTTHPRLGLPIHSLYSDTRVPEPGLFAGCDAVLIDLQDVGTRVYTFAATALFTLEAAHRAGVPVIVLDRPNPIGGAIEGPVLREGFHSFVGQFDVPLRHGLTIGELCRYGARQRDILPADGLRVVPLEGWRRSLHLDETGLPWTMPSPNLPTLEAAIVYPGQVVLEGTNLSEGRGTTRPFELCGAPYCDPAAVAAELARLGAAAGSPCAAGSGPGCDVGCGVGRGPGSGPRSGVGRGPDAFAGSLCGAAGTTLDGVVLREVHYQPTFHQYAGRLVRGFQLHVTDRRRYRPVRAVLALLAAVRRAHPDDFDWRRTPYEYERDRLAVDLIFGTAEVRAALEAGAEPEEIAAAWEPELRAFEERVRPARLYEE